MRRAANIAVHGARRTRTGPGPESIHAHGACLPPPTHRHRITADVGVAHLRPRRGRKISGLGAAWRCVRTAATTPRELYERQLWARERARRSCRMGNSSMRSSPVPIPPEIPVLAVGSRRAPGGEQRRPRTLRIEALPWCHSKCSVNGLSHSAPRVDPNVCFSQ